jgi:tight adherence protein B
MRAALLAAALTLGTAVALAAALRSARHDGMLRTIIGAGGSSGGETDRRRRRRSPRRAREIALGCLAVAVLYAMAGPPGGAVALLAAVGTPRLLRRRRDAKHDAALESQLAGAVSALSAGLRAGLSLSQSLRFAEEESSPPLEGYLRQLIEAEELGMPLDVSLAEWERASDSPDLRLVASVLRLRIGAGLPGVLDQVGISLRSRQSARRELRSLTAQARLSGTILSATSREEMAAAYGTAAGITAIVGGLILQAGAFVWIRRLVGVEPA